MIELSQALLNIRSVKLSEIADSITYVPLSNEKLIGGRGFFNLSDNYIFAGSDVYDWNGNYKFKIGNRGQGPGEEVALYRVIECGRSFYSMGDKLIVYDEKGIYAGKERKIIGDHIIDLGCVGTSGIVTSTLDSLQFWNKDLNLISGMRVVPDWPEKSIMYSGNSLLRIFTANLDSVLFYNYINDTIYRVLDDKIEPRWVIDLKESKIPTKYLLGNEMNRLSVGAKYYTNGNLSDWEYLKDTDSKIRISSVYESTDYVFVYWFRLFDFWQLRNLPPTKFQIAYFNKHTGKTVAVDGDGFKDDISSLGTFYPFAGIHGNSMITSYWPYELQERVDSLQRCGEQVDKKLLDLLEKMSTEDNPIIVMVHLKDIGK